METPSFEQLMTMPLRLVIMSRGRARSMSSHRLFPTATLVVPESEADSYRPIDLDMVTVPDAVAGISALRNWIIGRFQEEAIVMIDDDIAACVCLVSLRCRKLSPEETLAMISNTAHCAREAGACVFGWHQRTDPKHLQRNDPFGVTHWVGGVLGVIGKEPRWDELLRCKCDIDACLTEFLERRIVWQDARFGFQQQRDKNMGGNSLFRNAERIELEKRHLKRKWKAHIRFEGYKSQERVSMVVERRQSLRLGS